MNRKFFRHFGLSSVSLLIAADIVLSFAYASLPITRLGLRGILSVAQLITMGLTMLVALKWLLKEF